VPVGTDRNVYRTEAGQVSWVQPWAPWLPQPRSQCVL